MGHLVVRHSNDIREVSKPNRIVFLSDLHLDFSDGEYHLEQSYLCQKKFISEVKEECQDGAILCLMGDIYNDYGKTLAFIEELEREQIFGFCVLGNHNYWNGGKYTISEITQIFDEATKDNQYFRLLMTGRKYYVGDLCVIGDTGWTSFRYRKGRRMSFTRPPKGLPVIPEFKTIKGFTFEEVLRLHNEWITYANSVYKSERDVLTLTHYPMVSFADKQADTWWSSHTDLQNDSAWCLFGHTHDVRQKYYNHLTHQRGYGRRTNSFLFGELSLTRLSSDEELHPALVGSLLSTSYITTDIDKLSGKELSTFVANVRRRGYKRITANIENMRALIQAPDDYLAKVEDNLNGYVTDEYSGYMYDYGSRFRSIFPSNGDFYMFDSHYGTDYYDRVYKNKRTPSESDLKYIQRFNRNDVGYLISTPNLNSNIIRAVRGAIDVIRRNDMRDIRVFMTAVVVTGYVYNNMIFLLPSMRPLDDYDIVRLAIMFFTIQRHGLDFGYVWSVRRSENKDDFIMYKGVPIHLPMINFEYILSKEEVSKFIEGVTRLGIPTEKALIE